MYTVIHKDAYGGSVYWAALSIDATMSAQLSQNEIIPKNVPFLPRDAMHKRGICQHAVSVTFVTS